MPGRAGVDARFAARQIIGIVAVLRELRLQLGNLGLRIGGDARKPLQLAVRTGTHNLIHARLEAVVQLADLPGGLAVHCIDLGQPRAWIVRGLGVDIGNLIAPFLPCTVHAAQARELRCLAHLAYFVVLRLQALHLFAVELGVDIVHSLVCIEVSALQILDRGRFLLMVERAAAQP